VLSNPAAAPTLIALKIQACAPGPACNAAAVGAMVASGTVKATSTSRTPDAATASVADAPVRG
jgi:hypothetical protein